MIEIMNGLQLNHYIYLMIQIIVNGQKDIQLI